MSGMLVSAMCTLPSFPRSPKNRAAFYSLIVKKLLGSSIIILFLCHSLVAPNAYADRGIAEVSVKAFIGEEQFARTNAATSTAYKLGFSIGGALRYDFVEWFAIQPELVYASRGSDITLDGNYLAEYQLRYLELPVLLRATLPRKGRWYGYLVAGPSISYLLGANVSDFAGTADIKEDFISFDVGGVVGIGGTYEIASRWAASIDVRYAARSRPGDRTGTGADSAVQLGSWAPRGCPG